MSVIEESTPSSQRVRIGSYNTRVPGPLGTTVFESETVTRRGRPVELYFQETSLDLIENARIRAHGEIEIPCHRGTRDQLRLLDATLALVPPEHLRLVNSRKPQGFLLSDSTGLGDSLSYTGGLNAGRDYRATPLYDETQLILITYGALWENRDLGICPTVMHEIGHVMTHRSEISYGPFPEERAQALRGTTASRNPGELEALCNAYMYMLCYGASVPAIHNYGANPVSSQKDRVTRDALRRCRAFRAPLLDEAWQARYAER